MPGLRAALGPVLIAAVVAQVLSACGSSSSTSTTSSAGSVASSTTSASASYAGNYSGHTELEKLRGVSGTHPTVAIVKRFPHIPPGAVTPHIKGFQGLSLVDKLSDSARASAGIWIRLFSQAGASLPPARLELIAGQPASCGANQITAGSSPEYCISTDTIELPLGFMSANIAPLGDSALVLMVADLYGYHVERALGLFSHSLSRSQLELTDSCFSGVFFEEVYGSLEPSDETGVNRLLAASAPVSATGDGPSAAQLTNAFNTGIVYRAFQPCLPAGT